MVAGDERKFLNAFAFKLEECHNTIMNLHELASNKAEEKVLDWTVTDRGNLSALGEDSSPVKGESNKLLDFTSLIDKKIEK